MASHLTIAEVAERTGLSAHTLRYYERAGLIAPVARAPGGQRRYAASDMEWIGFLLRLRETQMPIGQMQAFARLRSEGNATIGARRSLLEQHLQQVLATIAAMQQAAQALQTKIGHYEGLEASLRPTQTTSSEESTSHAPRNPKSSLRPGPRQAARDRRPGR
ncbi:MerR family transcriptional regulator [Acidovorax sp. CF316]|uniref:MerR family transcriptional regulator n=1 Tax=Acidovorax sp. CF316 TaxID=1144317 RepID=UPI0002EB2DE1|nr:MerR family transcriptional regulator [Acidovorax sp. CF316]